MGNTDSVVHYETFDVKKFASEYSLNTEQVMALLNVFRAYSNTGLPISKETFNSLIKEASVTINSNLFSTESYFSRVFDMLDVNHDNAVDCFELLAGLTILSSGSIEQKAELAFRAYDLDEDGSLSRDEVKQVIQKSFESRVKFLGQQAEASKANCHQLVSGFGVKPGTAEAAKIEKQLEEAVESVVQEQLKKETSAELAEKILESFFQADDDQDGKISLEEWRQHASTNPVIRRFLLPGGFAPPKYLAKEGRSMLPKSRSGSRVSSSQGTMSPQHSQSSSQPPRSVPSSQENVNAAEVLPLQPEVEPNTIAVDNDLDYARALLGPGSVWKGELTMSGFSDEYRLEIGPRGPSGEIRGAHTLFMSTSDVVLEVYPSIDRKSVNVDYADSETACVCVIDLKERSIAGTCTQLGARDSEPSEFKLALQTPPKQMPKMIR